MPILSVFAPLLKSRFFVIYFRGVTLADEKPPLCKGRWPSDSEVGGIDNPPPPTAEPPLHKGAFMHCNRLGFVL